MLCMFIACVVAGAYAACPDENTGLAAFSSSTLATGLTKSSNISITSGILLDQDLDVSYIDISGSGSLVFKRGRSTVVKTKGIMVRGSGSLLIGDSSCRHEDSVRIVLQGTRDASLISEMEEGLKYIAVKDQGSLNIHGKIKRGWTKLSATVNRYNNDPTKVKYDHMTSTYAGKAKSAQGIAMYKFDNTTLAPTYYSANDFYKNGDSALETNKINNFISKLQGVADGEIVMLSVQNRLEISAGTSLTAMYDAIETAAGMASNSLLLRESQMNDAFAIVFVKGSPSYTNQAIDYEKATLETHVVATTQFGDYKLSAISHIYAGSSSKSFVDFHILTLDLGYPTITVLDDISSWEIGDEILLASTDFAHTHAEVRKIKSKPTSTSIQLDGELIYRHFGAVEDRVDMRAEVALLTRNIKIEGEMARGCPASNGNCDKVPYDSFGGHIKILRNFSKVEIQDAELFHMGQSTQKSFYPIHFHMCLDVSHKSPLIKSNSIHQSLQRAVTVHGTYGNSTQYPGVRIVGNVVYQTLGHAYFLEEGIEVATLLEGNFGSGIRSVDNNFATDSNRPTVYWITNPKVTIRHNVAAGSDGLGFWFAFPNSPVGHSAGLIYQADEARHTPLWEFYGNVGHSCKWGALFFDDELLNANGQMSDKIKYYPKENPLDPDSADVKVPIHRFTAYKNEQINIWMRGGYFELMQLSSAESTRSVQLARGSNQQHYVRKSVIIGRSKGNYEDSTYPDGIVVPHYLGILLYDGPQFVYNTSFLGFKSDPAVPYVSGALSFKPDNAFVSASSNAVEDLRFGFADKAGGNRMYAGELQGLNTSTDGDRLSTFRDIDGTLTKCPGDNTWTSPMTVAKPTNIILTERCKYRPNWEMIICDDFHGKMKTLVRELFTGDLNSFNDKSHMKRIEFANTANVQYEWQSGEVVPEFITILGDHPREFYYEYQFAQSGTYPANVRYQGKGMEKNKGAVVGVCLPAGVQTSHIEVRVAMAKDQVYKNDDMIAVSSLEEVSNSTNTNKYYINGRFLYFKLESSVARQTAWEKLDTDHCPLNFCPYAEITLSQAYNYTPCFSPTSEQLSPTVNFAAAGVDNLTCEFPAADPAYEGDWGAGEFKSDMDGAWGEWRSWSDCCNEPGQPASTTTRTRDCDNPPQYGNGADCVGPSVETAACTKSC